MLSYLFFSLIILSKWVDTDSKKEILIFYRFITTIIFYSLFFSLIIGSGDTPPLWQHDSHSLECYVKKFFGKIDKVEIICNSLLTLPLLIVSRTMKSFYRDEAGKSILVRIYDFFLLNEYRRKSAMT